MKRISIFFCLLALLACRQNLQTASPDGSIVFEVSLDTAGVPQYTVSMDGKPVLGPSPVGLEAEGLDIYSGYKVRKVTRRRVDEAWEQPWGENKEMRDRHRETAVFLENPSGVRMTLRVRVFDDGAGFRCEYDAPADTLRILRENTGFRFAEDGTSWSIESNFDSYECPFRKLPISGTPDANTPFTFLAGDVYGSIHEAALYDFPEMNLERVEGTEFRSRLAPLPGTEAKAVVPGAFKTPWRTVQLGRRAVDLINSSLILNLNEPSKIEDTSWIKPQKYVGVWWGMHLGTQSWTMGPRHGATTENALRHIDFAAANNIQGVLFEGWNYGWDTWGGEEHFDYTRPYADFDLPRIKAHADSLGVALWLHNETGGNVPEYEAAIDTAFALYEKWGIHTVKTGYAGGMPNGYAHHSQYGVRHYQKVVEAAAAHRIAIDAHEPIKETGIRRTWPNMMTREGARGMEWNAWSAGNSPEHLCTLPFTRLLGGPMDYTPGVFDIYYEAARRNPDRKPWNGDYSRTCIKTTLARQIANWVILYSPLQMACDLIENYEGHPAFQFFRDFDADCDFSKALDGEIGEYIAVVRRAGDRYFLGAGTDSSARALDIPLDFLEPGKEYDATVYADDLSAGPTDVAPTPEDGVRDRRAYRIKTLTVTSRDTIHVEMAPGGGQAVSFIPSVKLCSNPVVVENCPDPSVLDNRDIDGYFYLYSTQGTFGGAHYNLPVYRSTDLVSWERVADGFPEGRPSWEPEGKLWAPDVHRFGNKYIVYYALGVWDGLEESASGVAVGSSPEGPFKDLGMLVSYSNTGVLNSIDPDCFQDGRRKYLYWGSLGEGSGIWGVELSGDGLSVRKGAVPVKLAGDRKEGAHMHKRGGWYYLFASEGTCCEKERSTYRVIVGRSRSPLGPFVSRSGMSMICADDAYDGVILKGTAEFAGPGHNSAIVTDDDGRDWMLMHAWWQGNGYESRSLVLQEVLWDGDGWPYFKDSSVAPVAAAPVFR